MNFVFYDENLQQNLNNQNLQQILDLQNIYGPIFSQNVQPNFCPLQSLLLQQLIQLQQYQQSQLGVYPECYNQALSTSSVSSSPTPYIHAEEPPENPLFPLFPRIYNAHFDQLKQLQDPKSKYNLGSKKDKEGGGYLNNFNTAPLIIGEATEQQQQQQYLSQGTKDIQKTSKQIGFQRVAKKSPVQSDIQNTTVSFATMQPTGITQYQEILNSFTKTEEDIIRQKQELIVDSASTSGTKSPVLSMLMMLKTCDQDTNSQLETACEPIGIFPQNCFSSQKKDISEEISSCVSSTINQNTTQTAPAWSSILKEWNFEKLKSITDPSIIQEMALHVFKNQLNSVAPLSSANQQILCGQHQQFTSSSFNTLFDQMQSQGRESSSQVQEKTQNSTTSSSSSSSTSNSSSSSSSSVLGLDRNILSKENCNLETISAAITGESSSESSKNRKQQGSDLIVSNISQYLDSLNLRINFKQQENYALIFNKKTADNESNRKDETRDHRAITSPALREEFDQELLAASSLTNQFVTCPALLLEQEDAIIEEGMDEMNNLGSSSDGTDEENQIDSDQLIARDPIKVKKRRGLLATAPLETKQQEQQSSNPVKKQMNESKNAQVQYSSNSSKNSVITSKVNKNGQDQSSNNVSSVQDTFMNARRNKKREQKIQQTIEQNSQLSTKFHNLTRLLMYKIIQIFKDEANLRENYNINPELSSHLKRIAGKIKQHSRDTCKSSIKTNFYTHSHYNVLFLTLNEENIKTLAANQKDVDAHKFIFGLDLANASAIHLTFANIIKSVAYEIVKKNLEASIMKEQLQNQLQQSSNSNSANGYDKEQMQNHISNLRSQYFQRAFQGITKMNNGQIVSRF